MPENIASALCYGPGFKSHLHWRVTCYCLYFRWYSVKLLVDQWI